MTDDKTTQLITDLEVARTESMIYQGQISRLENQNFYLIKEISRLEAEHKQEIRKLQSKNLKQLKIIEDLVAQNNPIISGADKPSLSNNI